MQKRLAEDPAPPTPKISMRMSRTDTGFQSLQSHPLDSTSESDDSLSLPDYGHMSDLEEFHQFHDEYHEPPSRKPSEGKLMDAFVEAFKTDRIEYPDLRIWEGTSFKKPSEAPFEPGTPQPKTPPRVVFGLSDGD